MILKINLFSKLFPMHKLNTNTNREIREIKIITDHLMTTMQKAHKKIKKTGRKTRKITKI
jgi:hypothetical protein